MTSIRHTITTLWTEDDIWSGRRFNTNQHSCDGHAMIGYEPQRDSSNNFCFIALSDGMVWKTGMSKKQVLRDLNDPKNNYVCQFVLDKIKENDDEPI